MIQFLNILGYYLSVAQPRNLEIASVLTPCSFMVLALEYFQVVTVTVQMHSLINPADVALCSPMCCALSSVPTP